ncbi:MAG: YihY/virulence factor BrkB family protein [Chloroflexi bacterium]|nr:YihY/virulence factor BrkB family protein [Chloroflexota bacterium]
MGHSLWLDAMSLVVRGKAIVAAVQASGLGQLVRRYGEDRADLLAAVVAFNALFSMFPIILGVLAIVGLIVRSPDAQAKARAFVLSTVPADGMASVLQAIDGARQNSGLIGLLSLVGLLWAGSSLFGALEAALDRVYRVPSRSFVRQKLMSVGMMLLFALMVVAELVTTTVTHLVGRIAQSLPLVVPGVAPAVAVAGGAISLLAAFALCFAIYYVVPNVRLTAGHVLPGTLFASLALVLLSQLFPLYVLFLGRFNQYGAIFGIFFLLMTWAYLVAEALMVGAELNALFRPAVSEQRQAPKLAEERHQPPKLY